MPRPASIIARFNSILNTPGFGFHTPASQEASESPQDGLPYTRFPFRSSRQKSAPAPAPDAPEADPFPAFRSHRASRDTLRVAPRRVALPEGHVPTARPVMVAPGPEPGPAIAMQEDTFRFVEDLPEGVMSIDVSAVEAVLRKHTRIPDDLAVSSDFRRGYELAVKKIALGIYNRLVDKRQEGA